MADVSRVEYNDEPLIDLTNDTVTPMSLRSGVTAHNAAGDLITGVGGGITVIDDEAGRGDWDKVWSADKTWRSIDDVRRLATGQIHNEGSWNSTNEYSKYAAVTANGNSYMALDNVPAGIDIHNNNYWLKLAEAGGPVNIDDLAGEGDTIVTWSADKIFKSLKPFVNVANYTNGVVLSSSNIAEAITAALEDSNYIYIPEGNYEFNIDIEIDCTMMLSDDTYISSAVRDSSIYAKGCSFSMIGGHVVSGDNTDSRVKVGNGQSLAPGHISGAIVVLDECHDCMIYKVDSPYSQSTAVFCVNDSQQVEFVRCTFDHILQAAIFFTRHCQNVAVRNCSFKNSRYMMEVDGVTPRYYCYFVYTGSAQLTDNYIPTDGLIYENNYCNGSEDCGLDTHGAKNVIIRGNTVLQTVCAITAYNDNSRVKRPAGWCMENILIENNYCESDKANDPNTSYPHSFLFLGASNDHSGSESDYTDNVGRYNAYRNCVVRNNTFISTAVYDQMVSLHSVAQNVIIENNVFDGPNKSYIIKGKRVNNLILRNNQYVSKRIISLTCSSSGEIYDNVTLASHKTNLKNYFYIFKGNKFGADFSYLSNVEDMGDINFYSGNDYNARYFMGISNSLGRRANYLYEGDMLNNTYSVTAADGIVTLQNHIFLPGMRLKMNTSYYYVKALIDIDHFSLVNSLNNPIADGTYTLSLEFANDYIYLNRSLQIASITSNNVKDRKSVV